MATTKRVRVKDGALFIEVPHALEGQWVEITISPFSNEEPEPIRKTDRELFEKFLSLLSSHYAEYSYADLYASVLSTTQKRLNDVAKKMSGKTACQLVEEKVIAVSKQLLTTSDLPMKEIAARLGYEDPYYFSRMFKRHTRIPPATFRKKKSK